MSLNIEKFSYISRISLIESEKNEIENSISNILDYINILQKANIENNYKENKNQNIFRNFSENIVFDKNFLLKNAPNIVENFFAVPTMVKRS
jgi:aspartyl/glutamyl-tRNA(Asn/Gln) amidotransferase C subunit